MTIKARHKTAFWGERLTDDKGFSLIEVMVVLVIIGLMTTAAVVLLPSGDKPEVAAAQKTAYFLQALQREAVVSGKTIGLKIREGVFDVRSLSEAGWTAENAVNAPDTKAFLSHADLSLVGQGAARTANTLSDTQAEDARRQQALFRPDLWFLPTGEFLPFSLTFEEGRTRLVVAGAPNTAIRFVPAEDDRDIL